MRVLDLGCGVGRDLAGWGVTAGDRVTGIDIDEQRLLAAKHSFQQRIFLQGAGEHLPCPSASFDRVIAGVALPYMNIQKALAEVHRVLVPGGRLSVSLHLPSFVWAELVHNAFPRPVPTIYRLYVISNGLFFHVTGKTVGFMRGRTESFQTVRGMSLALRRAGFCDLSFRRGQGPAGDTFIVEAYKAPREAIQLPELREA